MYGEIHGSSSSVITKVSMIGSSILLFDGILCNILFREVLIIGFWKTNGSSKFLGVTS